MIQGDVKVAKKMISLSLIYRYCIHRALAKTNL